MVTFNIVDKDGTIWARRVQAPTCIRVASYLLGSQDPHSFTVTKFDSCEVGTPVDLVEFCKRRNIAPMGSR